LYSQGVWGEEGGRNEKRTRVLIKEPKQNYISNGEDGGEGGEKGSVRQEEKDPRNLKITIQNLPGKSIGDAGVRGPQRIGYWLRRGGTQYV